MAYVQSRPGEQPVALSMKSIVVVGDTTHVVMVGDIDWSDLASLRAGLDIHLRRTADVVLNLSALRSWSVSGQAVLVGALRSARREGHRVVLRGLHGPAAAQVQRSGLMSELLRAIGGDSDRIVLPEQRSASGSQARA